MSKILFVEDNLNLIKGLSYALEKEGYNLTVAKTTKEAYKYIDTNIFDLIILDISLPDGSGYDVCKYIREISDTAIIFLTAKDEELDIIMGLDLGADDYITKPFKLSIFLSKIKAVLRRSKNSLEGDNYITSHDIKLDLLERCAYKNGIKIELTSSEFKLLHILIENEDIVLTQDQILNKLWDFEENYINSSTLSVYIHRLRNKIEDDSKNPKRIITVRSIGYKWHSEMRQ